MKISRFKLFTAIYRVQNTFYDSCRGMLSKSIDFFFLRGEENEKINIETKILNTVTSVSSLSFVRKVKN